MHRGLYKTQDGKYINADVNAAANIIKKKVSTNSITNECVSGSRLPRLKSNYKHKKSNKNTIKKNDYYYLIILKKNSQINMFYLKKSFLK